MSVIGLDTTIAATISVTFAATRKKEPSWLERLERKSITLVRNNAIMLGGDVQTISKPRVIPNVFERVGLQVMHAVR